MQNIHSIYQLLFCYILRSKSKLPSRFEEVQLSMLAYCISGFSWVLVIPVFLLLNCLAVQIVRSKLYINQNVCIKRACLTSRPSGLVYTFDICMVYEKYICMYLLLRKSDISYKWKKNMSVFTVLANMKNDIQSGAVFIRSNIIWYSIPHKMAQVFTKLEYSQNAPHTSPSLRASYTGYIMTIFKRIDRVTTAPHCSSWLPLCCFHQC